MEAAVQAGAATLPPGTHAWRCYGSTLGAGMQPASQPASKCWPSRRRQAAGSGAAAAAGWCRGAG